MGSIRFSDEENAGFFGTPSHFPRSSGMANARFFSSPLIGPSSNIAFTRDIVSATTSALNSTTARSVPDRQANGSMHSHVLHISRPPSPIPGRPGTTLLPDPPVRPFDMPPPERTLELVRQYFSNTNLLFPYIHRESFLATYHEMAASGFTKVRRSWLGLLNLILAMSVSASEHGGLDARQRRAESAVFFRRAMALCEKQIRFGASLEIGTRRFLSAASTYAR